MSRTQWSFRGAPLAVALLVTAACGGQTVSSTQPSVPPTIEVPSTPTPSTSQPASTSVAPTASSTRPLATPQIHPTGQIYHRTEPLPDASPGTIVRAEPVRAPDGILAWVVLYLSTGLKNEPIGVSGIVLAPAGEPAADRPILAWAHASRGVSDRCAPSHAGAGEEIMEIARPFLDAGYVVAATDYPGLGTEGTHPFLVGLSEGRGVLDILRAAQRLPEAGAGKQIALLGESQGGHAALWAAQIAPDYAPELDVAAVAVAATAGDLPALANHIRDPQAPEIDWLIGLQIISVWAEIYGLPMDGILSEHDQGIAAILPEHCPDVDFAPSEPPLLVDLSSQPGWSEQLEANTPGGALVTAPILIVHGTEDVILPISTVTSEERRLCAIGDVVEFRQIEGGGHPDPLHGEGRLAEFSQWITERLAGSPATDTCQ